MFLDPEDRSTCHHQNEIPHDKKKKNKHSKSSLASSGGCEAIEYDETSMEIHYSKPANSDGKFSKGTVVRAKCKKGFVSDAGGKLRKRCRKDGSWAGRDGGSCHVPTCHALSDLPPEVIVEPEECAQVLNNTTQCTCK